MSTWRRARSASDPRGARPDREGTTRTRRRRLAVGVAVGIAVTAFGAASGEAQPAFHNTETRYYRATLEDTATQAPRATFTARVTVGKRRPMGRLEWHLTVRGLRGQVLEAHIHRGPVGRSGPIVVPLCVLCASDTRGNTVFPAGAAWFDTVYAGGSGVDRPAYVDVHTSVRPRGTLRAQLITRGWMAYWTCCEGQDLAPPNASAPP